MGRPRKVYRLNLISDWRREWELGKRPIKNQFARRYEIDRRTVIRILREAVDSGQLPLEAIGPRPFKSKVEVKSQGFTFAW